MDEGNQLLTKTERAPDARLTEYRVTIVGSGIEPETHYTFMTAMGRGNELAKLHSPAEVVVEELVTEFRRVGSYRVQSVTPPPSGEM